VRREEPKRLHLALQPLEQSSAEGVEDEFVFSQKPGADRGAEANMPVHRGVDCRKEEGFIDPEETGRPLRGSRHGSHHKTPSGASPPLPSIRVVPLETSNLILDEPFECKPHPSLYRLIDRKAGPASPLPW